MKSPEYFRGRIKEFDPERMRGVIWPDEGQAVVGQLLLRRKSLRNSDLQLAVNDRVLFTTESIDRGLLATDVHHEMIEEHNPLDPPERVIGRIKDYRSERGFGFVALQDGHDAFFHFSYLSDPDVIPIPGSKVSCRLVATAKGIQAQDIIIEEVEQGASPITGRPNNIDIRPQNWLERAFNARTDRRYDDAAKLYEKGLQHSPSLPLLLSYAAMEKERKRNHDAMRIYERGLRLFPKEAKLREDAGLLAASLGTYPKALKLLHEALYLCRANQHRGEKGILLALARTYYRMDDLTSLKEAVKYYGEAQRIFVKGNSQLQSRDLLSLNLAKIRTQHHRGNLTVLFLRTAKFEIIRARLLDIKTEGAEFIVKIDDPEFRESYGLSEQIVVRCMFKANVELTDLEDIDESVKSHDWVDEQVALLVISSLPANLQMNLSARVEQKKKDQALAIVPIQQAEIETLGAPLVVLRDVLDRWLYRRDLFAGNVPVVGRRFFGRDKPLSQIRDAITTSTPTGIFGLRKVGKTSLLQESQRRASESGDIVVYMDLLRIPADVTDCRWLYFEIEKRLKQEAEKLQIPGLRWRLSDSFEEFLDIPPTFPVSIAFDSDFKRLLQAIRKANYSPRPKVVLLLDEIERLLPTSLGKANLTGSIEFFSYLRGISQEISDFVVIITGANTLITEAAQFEGRDNPVFNFFNDIYLQFLEEEEADLMMKTLGRGMGIRFEVGAIFSIYSLTGGHPFFTKQLCSFIAEQHPERPLKVTRSMVADLVEHYLTIKSSDFEEIIARLERDYPNELSICVELAKDGGSLPVAAIGSAQIAHAANMSIRHLIGYQIVKVKDGKAFLTIDLLTRWLQKRYIY